MNKTKLALLSTLMVVLTGCASMLMPTQYVKPDSKRVWMLADTAQFNISRDKNRLELNGEFYEQAQMNAAFVVGAAGALGIPGAGLLALRTRRPGDMTKAEAEAYGAEMVEKFKETINV